VEDITSLISENRVKEVMLWADQPTALYFVTECYGM
jgi:hypothetical protein